MADTKITALAAITTVDPAADVLPIVDISDTSMAASGTTKKITSNQILGAGGTATLASATITGAATVGTTLGVTGVSTFAAGTALLPGITTTGDTNTGIFNPAADTWAVSTGGTERFRVDSTGLGVGVTPSAGRLHIKGGASQSPLVLDTLGYNQIVLQLNGANRGQIYADATNCFALVDSTGSNLRLVVTDTGNVGVGVTPVGTGGCLQLKSGITFPATQVASSDANTLDDYEEGTFTPTIVGTTSAGTGTYTTQFGRYTKIGRVVTVDINITWTAHTGTGGLEIDGLPFSVLSTSGYSASASIGYFDNITLTAGNVPLFVLWWFNTTKIRGNQIPTGGGAVTGMTMDSAGQIALSVTYIVA